MKITDNIETQMRCHYSTYSSPVQQCTCYLYLWSARTACIKLCVTNLRLC